MDKKYKISKEAKEILQRKKVYDMATISFERQIIIESEKAIDVLYEGLSGKFNKESKYDDKQTEKELFEGREALAKLSYLLKKSY